MRFLRATLGVLGELLVTAGVVVLLFVAWQVGYSSLIEGRAQAGVVAELEASSPDGSALPELPDGPLVAGTAPSLDDGAIFAIIRIPRFGADWARPVYEGITQGTLAKGPGHYPRTALPGQIGNMAIAGHRTTHGHPFFEIDALVDGDVIVIETRQSYVVYRMARSTIVRPSQSEVVAAVPQKLGAKPTEAWLTLTSCHPKFSAAQRYIVFAKLDRVVPRSEGAPPELTAAPAPAALSSLPSLSASPSPSAAPTLPAGAVLSALSSLSGGA